MSHLKVSLAILGCSNGDILHFVFVGMKNLYRKVFLLAMLLLLATPIIRANDSNGKITLLYAL